MAPTGIPVLLLKTRSQPDDGYEEYFTNLKPPASQPRHTSLPETTSPTFDPQFVPVLEHQPNTANLARLADLLRSGTLTKSYGGIIFTSQRAVEGFSDVVRGLDAEAQSSPFPSCSSTTTTDALPATTDSPTTPTPQTPFPLYVVGPATARSLSTLLCPSPSSSHTLAPLHPIILGAHTGNGAALAAFILQHYNALHAQLLFTNYEAPRLPFIPLVGPASGTYARRRRGWDDGELGKRALLFLVGETRRDVIPRVLGGQEGWVGGVGEVGSVVGGEVEEDGGRGRVERRVKVDEWEVYRTGVRGEFGGEFGGLVEGFEREERQVVVVVVFSPQGCEAMLRGLGLLRDGERRVDAEKVRARWEDPGNRRASQRDQNKETEAPALRTSYVIATIGPTTRDYLRDIFGFEPDVCAEKPSPEGVGQGVLRFLEEKGLLGC